jgi:hypothetical protein
LNWVSHRRLNSLKIEFFKTKTTLFESAYRKVALRFRNYPLHIADMQMFHVKKPDHSAATLRFVRSLDVKTHTRPASLSEIIKDACGLTLLEKPEKLPKGSLSPLTAHNLRAGPFRIALTENPRRHLTVDDTEDIPILQLLSLKTILSIFALQHYRILRSSNQCFVY